MTATIHLRSIREKHMLDAKLCAGADDQICTDTSLPREGRSVPFSSVLAFEANVLRQGLLSRGWDPSSVPAPCDLASGVLCYPTLRGSA